MTTQVIAVKAEHMRPLRGRHSACSECMVARALKDAGFTGVSVGYIAATANEILGVAFLPSGVTKKIGQFIDKEKIEPFTFTLSFEPRRKAAA